MISPPLSLSGPSGPLILVERGGGRFLLSGSRARAHGKHGAGVDRLEGTGVTLFRDLLVDLPPAEEVRIAPHVLERSVPAVPPVVERTFLPPDLAGAIVEWRLQSLDGPAPLRLSWIVPDATRWRLRDGMVAVRGADGSTRVFCLPESAELRVERVSGGAARGLRVDASVGWDGAGSIRFVAVLAGRGRRARLEALRPLRYVGAQEVRARSLLEEQRDAGLAFETPDPEISTALDWASVRLSAALARGAVRRFGGREANPLGALLIGLGAISLGRFGDAGDVGGAPPALGSVVARWRGDLSSRGAANVPETLDGFLDSMGMMDSRRAGAYAPWLTAWRGFEGGDVEAAYRELLDLARVGFGDLSGAWAVQEGAFDDPALTALVPVTLVFGLLGARADAHFGRLGLSPRFPAHWSWARVRNLRLGSSSVSLRYERDEGTHRFALRQTAGGTPVNLVFEPSLAVSSVRGVTVDGAPADLDRFEHAGRTSVRLQLPLDAERIVAVVGSD